MKNTIKKVNAILRNCGFYYAFGHWINNKNNNFKIMSFSDETKIVLCPTKEKDNYYTNDQLILKKNDEVLLTSLEEKIKNYFVL